MELLPPNESSHQLSRNIHFNQDTFYQHNLVITGFLDSRGDIPRCQIYHQGIQVLQFLCLTIQAKFLVLQ